MEKVNLSDKLAQFREQWKPKIVGELNGQLVKLVKFQGPFVLSRNRMKEEVILSSVTHPHTRLWKNEPRT